MTYDALPFSGIATFFKAPLLPAPTTDDADVAVVGIGWDEGTTSRSGARMGPRALREASTMYAFQRDAEPFWDGEAGVELLGGVRWADCGDVALGPMWSPERYHNAVVDKLQPIMESGLFPVTLGGDHSIGYPVLKALYQARGEQAVPPRPVRHAHGLLGRGGRLALLARQPHHPQPRGGLPRRPHAVRHPQPAHARRQHRAGAGAAARTSSGASRRRTCCVEDLVEHLPKGADVYITFDIDALDPAIAPGTGTPEPGGFSYYEAKDDPARRVRALQRGRHGPRRGGAAVRRARPGDGAARRPPDPRHGGRRLPAPRGASRERRPAATGRRSTAGPAAAAAPGATGRATAAATDGVRHRRRHRDRDDRRPHRGTRGARRPGPASPSVWSSPPRRRRSPAAASGGALADAGARLNGPRGAGRSTNHFGPERR